MPPGPRGQRLNSFFPSVLSAGRDSRAGREGGGRSEGPLERTVIGPLKECNLNRVRKILRSRLCHGQTRRQTRVMAVPMTVAVAVALAAAVGLALLPQTAAGASSLPPFAEVFTDITSAPVRAFDLKDSQGLQMGCLHLVDTRGAGRRATGHVRGPVPLAGGQ